MENPYRPFDEDLLEQERTQNVHFERNKTTVPQLGQDGKHVRLRALETESEYFLKTMNITSLRWLVWIQIGASLIIFMSQVLLYGVPTGLSDWNRYKILDYMGLGIWAPVFVFSVAAGLTWIAMKGPSGCNIGTSMGFQIASSLISSFLVFLAVISLMEHGRYNYNEETYDPEGLGRVFCSFIIVGAAMIVVSSVIATVHFCRTICCRRQVVNESVMFDVVAIK